MSTPTVETMTFTQLLRRAQALAADGRRRVLGLTGAPGAGKSTLAERLVDRLGPQTAVLVPVDGFHLADAVLHDLGRHARKGAHDTFDGHGDVSLLRRIREQRERVEAGDDDIIYAPSSGATSRSPSARRSPCAPRRRSW